MNRCTPALVFVVLLVLVGCVQHAPASTAGSPGRADLVIGQTGKSNATVIVSPQAGPWERRGATDLVRYIELMIGAAPVLADTREAIDQALGSRSPLLIVGREALDADATLVEALNKSAKKDPFVRADAIVLKRRGNRVYLAGLNDDCHYYAVAELLKRWGCRWYLPTGIGDCIPEHPVLKVGRLSYVYAPPFEIRTYWLSWAGDNTGQLEFMRRNMMTDRMVPPGWHALGQYVKDLVPAGAREPGHEPVYRMPIAEQSTAQHVADKLAAQFAQGKGISLGMEDGQYASDSPVDAQLRAGLWDKYMDIPTLTDAFMVFYNNVSRILQKRYPDSQSKIGFLAYSNITIPPQRDIIAEPPLIAFLAPIQVDAVHGMDDPRSPQQEEYKQMMYRWAQVMQGRLVIYDYDQSMFHWRDIPNPSMQMIARNIHHYRKAGILGIDTESRGATATTFLNLFVRGQLCWNPDVDVDALLEEFYPKFYDPAAKPMAAYWNAIFQAWDKTIVRERRFFAAPAIYTRDLVDELRTHLARAEQLVKPITEKAEPTRNEKLLLERMKFTRLGFGVLESYMQMVWAAGTDVDFAAAVKAGERGLALREQMTDMNPTFTTYRTIGESRGRTYSWWPGEVEQYRALRAYTDGTKGTLLARLPIQWAFRRDRHDSGLVSGWAHRPIDLSYWRSVRHAGSIESHMHNPGHWEMLRTDLYMQAQGVIEPDYRYFNGHAWYRTDVTLSEKQLDGPVHIMFPGVLNECWLYVNGYLVGHRPVKMFWWRRQYDLEWDVDLTDKLRPDKNTITLRIYNPFRLGGMYRRPFLYRPTAQ